MLINAYSTLQKPSTLTFPHVLVGGQRDQSYPELAPHLDGFIGYVLSTGNGQMTNTLYSVMRHIQRVQHHLSIEVADRDMDDFARWAWAANAIVFLPDGTVRDPSGRVLVSPDPLALDPQATVPYPADALRRKARSEQRLEALGIRVPASLPPVLGEGEVRLRTAAETAKRSVALFAVAVQAESMAAGEPIPLSELEERLPVLSTALSPAERSFLHQTQPDPQQVTNFVWRYESLALLQWALELVEELPFPTTICDVPQTARLALENKDEAFVEGAQLRSTSELLDALDLHYRLHWAVRQARMNEAKLPAELDASVIFERHHALNWLVRFEDKDWDEVDTPT